jgi:hypothetical protein
MRHQGAENTLQSWVEKVKKNLKTRVTVNVQKASRLLSHDLPRLLIFNRTIDNY